MAGGRYQKKQKCSKNTNKNAKENNHLITDYFTTISRSRRTTAKELALEQEESIRYHVKNKCDPKGSLHVVDIIEKGKGIIAGEKILKGSFICEYAGDLISTKEAQDREIKYDNENAGCYMYYFRWTNTQWCIDATKPCQRLGRLINHSRKAPNCKTRIYVYDKKPHLIFIALRDIEPNEELLYDYGERNKLAIEAHPWLTRT